MSGLRSLHTMNLFSRFFQENQEKFLAFAYSYGSAEISGW